MKDSSRAEETVGGIWRPVIFEWGRHDEGILGRRGDESSGWEAVTMDWGSKRCM